MASPSDEKINEFVVVLQENWEEVLAEQHQRAVYAETLPVDAVPAVVPQEGVVPAVVLLVELAPAVAQVVPAVVLLVELAPAVAQHGTWPCVWGAVCWPPRARQ